MYAEGAVVYVLAAVEVEATEATLFLLAGDSEPRGSSRRLISIMLEGTGLRQGHALEDCLGRFAFTNLRGLELSVCRGSEIAEAMQDDHLTMIMLRSRSLLIVVLMEMSPAMKSRAGDEECGSAEAAM